MRRKKSDLSDPEKIKVHLRIEKQLIPRLRFMGFVLFFFSFCALSYAVLEDIGLLADPDFSTEEENVFTAGLSLVDIDALESIEVRMLNSYLIALSFTFVGALCWLCAWKKKRGLKSQESCEEHKHP